MDTTDAADEVRACRICRSEEEPDAPLYHPCRCTGSIRYCHEDCLVQWLQHSQKKHCELCGYHFVFHKRYTHDMPDGLIPAWVYARYAAMRLAQAASLVARIAAVGLSWLIFVPYATLRVWTSYIQSCDWFAEMVLRRPVAALTSTQADVPIRESDSVLVVFVRYAAHELTKDWLVSVVLTLSIIIMFLGIFFLRESIMTTQAAEIDRANAEANEPQHAAAMRRLGQEAVALAQQRAQQMREVDVDALARQDALLHGHALPEEGVADVGNVDHGNDDDDDDDDDAWEDEDEAEAEAAVLEPRLHLPLRRPRYGFAPPEHPVDDEWVDEDEPQAAPLPPPPPLPRPRPAAPPDDPWDDGDMDFDENDENMAEGIDAALHALGLRGAWTELGQNLIFVQMLVILTMSVCVAVPYGLGRVIGFRAYDLILLPAKALRLVTDPVFELLIDGMAQILPTPDVPEPPPVASVQGASPAWLMSAWGVVSRAGSTLDACVRGGRVWQRALCVVLGHLYILATLALEARFGSLIHGGSTKMVSTAVQYYGAVLKSALILTLDFVGFPLFCGMVVDWCFLPLFAGASVATLIGQARAAPITFTFTRWVSGAVYMFFFAQFLDAIRAVVRPGVMSWIRDNADPDFQPLTEVVEDKLSTQLVKMVESAIMSGGYAVLVMGCATRALTFVPGLLPLYWAPLTPRTLAPVELLLVHFGLRIAVKRMRLPHYGRRAFRAFWIFTARCVRMSAYIMGDEQPSEHERVVYASWGDWARSFVQQHVPATRVPDGGYVRVPADQRPAPRTAMFIRTDAQGRPIDEEARVALERQQAVLDTMEHKAPYTIVYVPSRLRLRTFVILVLLWMLCTFVAAVALGVPLGTGRALAYVAAWPNVHDVYTWFCGCAVLGACAMLARLAYVLTQPRRTAVWPIARAVGRFAFHLTAFGGVLPLLSGIVLHQYLLTNTAHVTKFSAWYAWAYGALGLNTCLLITLLWVPDHVPLLWDMYDHMQAGRLWRVPVAPVTRRLVAPAVGALLAAICAPYLVACVALLVTKGLNAPMHTQLMYVYAARNTIVVCAAATGAWLFVHTRLDAWTDALRDEMFLESTQLCNFEEGQHQRLQNTGKYGSLPDAVARLPRAAT